MPDEDEASDFFDDLPKLSQQPIEVLTLARVHGAAWHTDLCTDAAFFGDIDLLKWLHTAGCPWDVLVVAVNAIRSMSGHYKLILPWLFSIVDDWPQDDKNELLFEAGCVHNSAALELMLLKGAEWPSSYVGEQVVMRERNVRACWHYKAVAWALSKGHSWGLWRCQDLAPDLYNENNENNRAAAVRLFKWAHKHGCPCTCEAAAAAEDTVVAA